MKVYYYLLRVFQEVLLIDFILFSIQLEEEDKDFCFVFGLTLVYGPWWFWQYSFEYLSMFFIHGIFIQNTMLGL